MTTAGVLQAAADLAARGEPAVLATVVWRQAPSSGELGGKALIHADGRMRGWIGGACAQPIVKREARRVLAEGRARLLCLGFDESLPAPPGDDVVHVAMACHSEGALQIALEPLVPAPHVVVVGATPMVDALAAMTAALGWTVAVADPDAGPGAHPAANRVVADLDLAAAGVTAASPVVVATQGHHDEDAVEAALATDAAYVALVASRRRGQRIVAYLRDRGVSEAALARLHTPAGLDLGATAHEEIAVAVLAELVARRAAGEPGPGAAAPTAETGAGQPGGADEMGEVEELATDPVCGMAVATAGSRHTAEHHGVTFHFCCPGCRAAFVADPTAHLAGA